LKPVPVDVDLVVEGREVEMSGRNLFLAGEIRNVAGQVLARAEGRFVIVDPKRIANRAAKNGAPEELAGKPLEK
jgi:acyl-CoA thioesterase FadM